MRDQYEIKHKTNIIEVLANNHSTAFETKPFYALKLSLDNLQKDEVYQLIKKVSKKYKSGINPMKQTAENLSDDDLKSHTEKKIHVNLHEVKKNLATSGKNLFDYVLEYEFPKEVSFGERVTIYCQMISIFKEEFEVSQNFNRYNQIEYAIVYPKNRK